MRLWAFLKGILLASALGALAAAPAESSIDLTGKWWVEYEDGSVEYAGGTDAAGAVSVTLHPLLPEGSGAPLVFTGTFSEVSLGLTLAVPGCDLPTCLAVISASVLPGGDYVDGVFTYYDGTPPPSRHWVLAHRCGCFDGNTTEGDGCDDQCRVEPCFTCTGMPSSCSPTPDAGACDDGSPCTTGETCGAGVCSGTPVAPCVDLSGTWDTTTSSALGTYAAVAQIEQCDTVVLFRQQTGAPGFFGTIEPATGAFALHRPQFGVLNCVGTDPLDGTAALDGLTFAASGEFSAETPTACFTLPFTQNGTRQICTELTGCVDGDGCCFGACTAANDSDCAFLEGDLLAVLDASTDAVFTVDRSDGDRSILSASGVGTGPSWDRPLGVAVDFDGDIVVSDDTLAALFRVDPGSGDRVLLSDASQGGGPDFSVPRDVAVEPSGTLLVADQGAVALFRVDPSSGDRTIVSDAAHGTGPGFTEPTDVTLGLSGEIYVLDRGGAAVLRVEAGSGNRTVVSSSAVGSGPDFVSLEGIGVEADGDLIVSDSTLDALFRVDPATGDRTIFSDSGTGSGSHFTGPTDLILSEDGTIFVTDSLQRAVYAVDPVSGNRTVVSSSSVGSGPSFQSLRGVAFLPAAGTAVPSMMAYGLVLLAMALAAAALRVLRRAPEGSLARR